MKTITTINSTQLELINEAIKLAELILQQPTNLHARVYARALTNFTVKAFTDANHIPEAEGVRTQILYILSNLQTWRGPLARETKARLKQIFAELDTH